MRSLFAKILVWFVLAFTATMGALVFFTAVTYDAYSSRQAPFSMLLGLELAEARHTWETEGPERLRENLQRFCEVSGASQAMLTDGNGVDVLTGISHASLLPSAQSFMHAPFSAQAHAFGRVSADGRYALILMRQNWYFWFLQPAHLAVLVLIVLFCYALAAYLTEPLRDLRQAMERFGQGELTTRARASRRDELGHLAASFNRMADHIQVLLGAERRLMFDISHELRSPLARLSVAVELARANAAISPSLDRIQKEADRLNDLICQLLDVTRAEGEPSRLRLEPFPLEQLLRMLIEECTIEARARGCEFALTQTAPVIVEGDAELLRRAFENIMRNAIRYAPAGTKIEISLEDADRWAIVRIRDHGPGVPEEALPRLCDSFYRVEADRDRKSGGVGLGLSIARRAVELHKGSLRASNAAPGLRMEIVLPAATKRLEAAHPAVQA